MRLVASEIDTGATATTSDAAACSVAVGVTRAPGTKCPRCWNYSTRCGQDAEHPELCERCGPAVQEMGFKLPAAAAAGVPKSKQATAVAA